MKVILLKTVENLGKKWDVKEVKLGYAKNYLIPQGLVEIATSINVRGLEERRKETVKQREKDLEITEKLAASLDGMELSIPMKSGESGELFGSVTKEIIIGKLKETNVGSDSNIDIQLEKPIKELGEYPITLRFDHNLEVEINVIVVPEKK